MYPKPSEMSVGELLDRFRFVAPCVPENEEYMEAALELAAELMNRGMVGPLVPFMAFLKMRAAA